MTDEDRLADLLVAWDDAHAAGRSVSPQDHCRDHPDLLEPFVRLLRQLGDINLVFDARPADPAAEVEQIDAGRYRPVSFHAAGGLGLVAVAEDRELNRTVALKVMQRLAALDPAARRRFQYEAEVTGRLEHPGIAPVYGAGEDPAGRPYYAMRFIRGNTLADAVRDYHVSTADPTARRLEFTRLLRCFAAVCQTVAYAHARGVLHRDIKPGNIMLGKYGETLLVDWGLAKEMDGVGSGLRGLPSGASRGPHSVIDTLRAAEQTRTGVAKGTPAYMAPEQAQGEWDRVGPAADVYALGATLYAVLAGQAPYTGQTAEAVMREVKAGPPQPVGQLNPAAPKPLEAVCAKAMARNPAHRYPSAEALAADVERWLADEPVTAYRDPFPTRVRRWVKRHRTAAASAAAAVLVVIAALAVVAPILSAKNAELTRVNGELNTANAHLTETNGKLTAANAAQKDDFEDADTSARALIDVVFARAVTEPGKLTGALRTDAVRKYRGYLRRFIDRNRTRPEVRLEVAAAWLKLAELDGILDPKADTAAADTAEAERLFTDLKAERPDDREVLYGWALATAQHGELLAGRGRWGDGLKRFDAVRPAYERLAADPAPVRLARMFSVPGVLENTPEFQLASVVFAAAELRRKVGQFTPALPGAAELAAEHRQTELRTALRWLTADRPLSADAPLFTRLRAIAIRLELADIETDPVKAVAAFTEIHAELKPLADTSGGAEFKALLMEADIGLGKAEAGVAQRRYADALTRGDTAAAVSAIKAFDAAIARLDDVVFASHSLRQADLGLDTFDLRARATTTPLEVSLAELQAVRGMERDDWAYVERTLTHLKNLAGMTDLPPAVAVRGLSVVGEYVITLGVTGYKKHLEQACVQGVILLDRLLADAPNEPVLVLMKANLTAGIAAARMGMRNWPPDAAGRAKMLQAARDAVDESERLFKSVPRDPTDWGQVIVEMQLLSVRAGLDPNDGQSVARCEALLAKIDEGEKLGMPADMVRFMRLTGEVMLVASLGGQAERHLDAIPRDPVAAGESITRALKLARGILARPVPGDSQPPVAAAVAYLRKRTEQVLPELEKLEARAKGK